MKMNKIGKSIYCRVCLRTDPKVKKKCTSLFAKYNDCSLNEIINSIADVKILQGDGLPSMICPDCLLELDTVVGFKLKCERSNTLLKSTILCNQQLIEHVTTPLSSSDEIKKEEPQELEEYLEEYLDEDCEYLNKTEINIDFEPKPEQSLNENTIDKNRKVIDRLECNECGRFFRSKWKIGAHWKKVHMYESLICPLCKRAFKTYKALNLHKKKKSMACLTASKVRVEGVGKARVFHCIVCSYTSKRVRCLQSHLVIHTGERPYICNICSKGFGQQTSLQDHQESAHKIYKAETICMYCGKHLKGRHQVYSHMRTHNTNYVQCDICKKFLKSKSSLIQHMKRHSNLRSFSCDKCKKTFNTISDLISHRRLIHEKGKRIFKCDICGFKAFTSRILQTHKSNHTSTNVPCLECGRFFEDAQKVAVHRKRIHFGERNFPCPLCEKRFLTKKTQRKHVIEVHKCTFLINKRIKQES